MTRICLIGNSHVAAMRLAWNAVELEYPDVEAHIFGAHASTLKTAVLEDGQSLQFDGALWRFRAGEEPGKVRAIPLENFDAYAIVGSGFGPHSVFQTYRRYHFSGLKARRKEALTREFFKRAAIENAFDSAAGVLRNIMVKAGKGPLALVPTPLPAEKGLDDHELPQMQLYRLAVESGDSEALMKIYDDICREQEALGLRILHQPESTKASLITSLQQYSDGSVRLREDGDVHPENDYFHMNADYGALVWRDLIKLLAGSA